MIIRDLYRCPTDDLHKAIAASGQTLLRRGVVEPPSAIELPDVQYLVAYPSFDPSLSFVAYDAGQPVAFLVSRIEGQEAVWSLFGGAGRALAMLLDEALAHWRREGATRARKGLTGLLGSEPRLTEDADLVSLLKERDFQVTATSSEMAVELKKLAAPKEVAEREAELRQKGYAVRAATPDEVAVVARQFHPRRTGQVSQESWNFLARHFVPDALVVAELRRQIIACLTYLGWTVGSPGPWLGPCFVEEVHRRTGLEGVLLHQALLAARQVGKERVRLHCPEAQAAFYQHAGFAVIARFCHEATADLQ